MAPSTQPRPCQEERLTPSPTCLCSHPCLPQVPGTGRRGSGRAPQGTHQLWEGARQQPWLKGQSPAEPGTGTPAPDVAGETQASIQAGSSSRLASRSLEGTAPGARSLTGTSSPHGQGTHTWGAPTGPRAVGAAREAGLHRQGGGHLQCGPQLPPLDPPPLLSPRPPRDLQQPPGSLEAQPGSQEPGSRRPTGSPQPF